MVLPAETLQEKAPSGLQICRPAKAPTPTATSMRQLAAPYKGSKNLRVVDIFLCHFCGTDARKEHPRLEVSAHAVSVTPRGQHEAQRK